MRSAIVLGAGMAGIGAALHLQQRNWSVVLVDRGDPGRETSYGNSGIIQGEAVEPYPMPRDWASLLAIATGRTNDVRFDLGALHHHLGPILRYWWHSEPRRHARATTAYAGLIRNAIPEHAALIAEAGADALVRRDGFRVLHRDPRAMEKAAAKAEWLREQHGVLSRILSPSELAGAEPALEAHGAGAVQWIVPWSIRDPGGLVEAYADLFRRRGGMLRRGDATRLGRDGSGWSLQMSQETLKAETVVVALGPWSPEFLRRFGYRYPMVRKAGYHRHWRSNRTLSIPMLDAANGYVMAPMAKGLRITTGAELAAPNSAPNVAQLLRAESAARELIELGAPVENEPWRGTRPCMPDMLPVVGEASRHPGLWFHFGHGHQGFTLGPTTGRLLAEMMSGETPFVPTEPFRPSRY